MVKKGCLFTALIVLFFSSCYNHNRNDAIIDSDFVILNKSLSDELNTVASDLADFENSFKDYLKYINPDFDPKRCNILVCISIQKGDTLVDFFQYDTLYKNELDTLCKNELDTLDKSEWELIFIFPVVGTFKSSNGITIQFADEKGLTKGILYETQQARKCLSVDIFHSLQKPMVLRNGKLIMNSPPLACDE